MFEYSQTANRNPETGIRYGVTNRVPSWMWDEIMGWDCPAWEDAKLEIAEEELKRLAYDGEVDIIELADFFGFDLAVGVSAKELSEKLLRNDSKEYKEHYETCLDEILSEMTLEQKFAFMDANFECELSNAMSEVDDSEWTKEGQFKNEQGTFKMMLTYLGGAPLLWVLEGPVITKARLCSPCLPGCTDQDSPDEDGYEGYGFPKGWAEEE